MDIFLQMYEGACSDDDVSSIIAWNNTGPFALPRDARTRRVRSFERDAGTAQGAPRRVDLPLLPTCRRITFAGALPTSRLLLLRGPLLLQGGEGKSS